MILIAAVLVAVAILGSVMLLNILHVPADLNTQQDARSLDAIERATPQVAEDLERIFLVHTSGDRLPYANESTDPPFEDVVGNYSNVTADLTASDASRVVSVEYLNSSHGSQNGTFLRHNDTGRELTNESYNSSATTEWDVMEGAESMPYLYIRVEGMDESGSPISEGHPFDVDIDGRTIRFWDNNVTDMNTNNELLSAADNSALYPVEFELIDGSGEVRNESARHTVDTDPSADFDVTFRHGNATKGTFTISGTDVDSSHLIGDVNGSYQYTREEVVVNPKFRVNFTDASVTHSTTFALYNRTQP